MPDQYKEIAQRISEVVLIAKISEVVLIAKTMNKPSIHKLSIEHGLPYQQLLKAYQGGNNKPTRAPTNRKLPLAQEKAVVQYITNIELMGGSVRVKRVESPANFIKAKLEVESTDIPIYRTIYWS